MMTANTGAINKADEGIGRAFTGVAEAVFKQYYDEEARGVRLTNNFLCFEPDHVHEM
jgi:hypothetical protein